MDYALEQRLDVFVRGESDETAFIEELCAACTETPDLAWDVLAITDQYHRRGKLSAELSRRIRHAIERPALALQAPELRDAMQLAPIVPLAPTAPLEGAARPVPCAATADVALQNETRAMRCEIDASRRTIRRYRARLAKLATFGRNQRDALASVRRELEASRISPPARVAPGLYEALDLLPFNRTIFSTGAIGAELRSRTRWIRPSQLAASIALLLTVTASPALREPPAAVMPSVSVVRAAAPAPAPAPATALGRQQLSLDRAQYVVGPRDRQALLRVKRTGGSTGSISFSWWTTSSGAKSGIDYRGRLPTIASLPDGVDAVTINIPIIANPQRLHTELFYAEIGHPAGGATVGAIRSSAVILMPTR